MNQAQVTTSGPVKQDAYQIDTTEVVKIVAEMCLMAHNAENGTPSEMGEGLKRIFGTGAGLLTDIGLGEVVKWMLEETDGKDKESLEDLMCQRKLIEKDKREFDRQEESKIGKIKEEIAEGTLDRLEDERDKKREGDARYRQAEQNIDEQIEEIGRAAQKTTEEVDAKVEEALRNTLDDEKRKSTRDPNVSNHPSSQQGPGRPDADGGTGAKRGAGDGHAGYAFRLTAPDGRDVTELSLQELLELSGESNIKVVILKPPDAPPGASVRVASKRVGFGMEMRAVPIVFAQEEAVWKDPENPRRLVRSRGEYPEWCSKSYTYSPEFWKLALDLRMRGHMSYDRIARFFREALGVTTTAKSVWNWARDSARYCCSVKREKRISGRILWLD